MRLLALVATLVALAATAFAGQALWQVIRQPVPALPEPGLAATQTIQPTAPPPAPRLTNWPAIFGAPMVAEPQPPQPVVAPPPEPQPPAPTAPPAPPIESLGFTLSGIVRNGTGQWAIVSHPTGDLLLRVGDMLGESYRVTAIDEQGLWAQSSPDAAPQLLAFAK